MFMVLHCLLFTKVNGQTYEYDHYKAKDTIVRLKSVSYILSLDHDILLKCRDELEMPHYVTGAVFSYNNKRKETSKNSYLSCPHDTTFMYCSDEAPSSFILTDKYIYREIKTVVCYSKSSIKQENFATILDSFWVIGKISYKKKKQGKDYLQFVNLLDTSYRRIDLYSYLDPSEKVLLSNQILIDTLTSKNEDPKVYKNLKIKSLSIMPRRCDKDLEGIFNTNISINGVSYTIRYNYKNKHLDVEIADSLKELLQCLIFNNTITQPNVDNNKKKIDSMIRNSIVDSVIMYASLIDTEFTPTIIAQQCQKDLALPYLVNGYTYSYDKKSKLYITSLKYIPAGTIAIDCNTPGSIKAFILTEKYIYMTVKMTLYDQMYALDSFWVAGKMDYREWSPKKNKLRFTTFLDTSHTPSINLYKYLKPREKILLSDQILQDTLTQKFGITSEVRKLKIWRLDVWGRKYNGRTTRISNQIVIIDAAIITDDRYNSGYGHLYEGTFNYVTNTFKERD